MGKGFDVDGWDDDDGDVRPRKKKSKKGTDRLELEPEPEDLQEWREERGRRGRKPVDERRPRRQDDDED